MKYILRGEHRRQRSRGDDNKALEARDGMSALHVG